MSVTQETRREAYESVDLSRMEVKVQEAIRRRGNRRNAATVTDGQ